MSVVSFVPKNNQTARNQVLQQSAIVIIGNGVGCQQTAVFMCVAVFADSPTSTAAITACAPAFMRFHHYRTFPSHQKPFISAANMSMIPSRVASSSFGCSIQAVSSTCPSTRRISSQTGCCVQLGAVLLVRTTTPVYFLLEQVVACLRGFGSIQAIKQHVHHADNHS